MAWQALTLACMCRLRVLLPTQHLSSLLQRQLKQSRMVLIRYEHLWPCVCIERDYFDHAQSSQFRQSLQRQRLTAILPEYGERSPNIELDVALRAQCIHL